MDRQINPPEDPVLAFYEQLAGDYHLIFADWRKAVLWQGEVLDQLLRTELGETQPLRILDCACGIGTQAIGLAFLGHRVHATDLSPSAVERARKEAASFGVQMTFGVADVRELAEQVTETFDAVIACDNAIPHLLDEDDLRLAAQQIHSRLRSGGMVLFSIRDYDSIIEQRPSSTVPRVAHDIVEQRPSSTLPRVVQDPGGRRVVFQVWDWQPNGRIYTVHQFILREQKDEWNVAHYATQYRALLRDELNAILSEAGFSNLRWHVPEISGYYQPIVTARK